MITPREDFAASPAFARSQEPPAQPDASSGKRQTKRIPAVNDNDKMRTSAQAATASLGSSGTGGGNGGGHGGESVQKGDSSGPLTVFTGQGLAYFLILLRTFFFSLLTLGVYSFWGKTRQRQYLWSNTLVLGEPLEYTGTGKELFLGFLMVLPVFLLISIAFGMIVQFFPPAGILIYLFLLYLWLYASFRALRYRLTRTRWRGIRGNLSGSPARFAGITSVYVLLATLSLGLAYPWASAKATVLACNNIWFGNRQLIFQGKARVLYRAFAGCVILGIVLLIASSMLLPGIMKNPTLPQSLEANPAGGVAGLAGMLVIMFALTIVWAVYKAAFFRWLCAGAAFGGMRASSSLTGWRYARVACGNLLLVIFTLGLGAAWAIIRDIRVRLNSVTCSGNPDLPALLQDTQTAPGYGEGLLEAMDMELGF